jgi:hypothetical protein
MARGPGRPRKNAQTEASTTAAPNGSAPPKQASNGPTNDQITAALADYTSLDTQAARLRQSIKTLLDSFEKLGGDKAELKALHKSLKLDPREAVAKLERRIRYHAGQGITLSWLANGQGTVLDSLGPEVKAPDKQSAADLQLAAVRAHTDGYNSGLRGAVPSDNPFSAAPGSEQYVQWHDGRDDGQRDREAKNPVLQDRIAQAAAADATLPPVQPAESPLF